MCYHDRLTSETTEERVSRLQQMSVHQRDKQTGMSDYRGEESQYSTTVHQTGIQYYVRGEGMIDWMASEMTEEEVGYSRRVLTCVIDWHPQFSVTFVGRRHCGECVLYQSSQTGIYDCMPWRSKSLIDWHQNVNTLL